MEASFYSKLEDKVVQCNLCPHNCTLAAGKTGLCRVRSNRNGSLYLDTYQMVSSISVDPVEKKPLYHYHPGRNILSIGSVGCNLRCRFCQNAEISQAGCASFPSLELYPARKIADMAFSLKNNIGVAYTYNEPLVWYEYISEIARMVHEQGQRNVMVTNGFINPAPLHSLLEHMDAFSVDLKGFDDQFLKPVTGSTLAPVLDTLKAIREAGRHLEIVNLVIPGQNDDQATFMEMVNWIAGSLGKETVLHLSAYYPRFLATEPPTPPALLLKFQKIARERLEYVYVGNIRGEVNITNCHSCHAILIMRQGYHVDNMGVDDDGRCVKCGNPIFQNY